MEAARVDALPEGAEWQYEPKWDGFRCLAFRDGENIELQSKSGQPLARYFPDLVAALVRSPAGRFVLDGEIVIPLDGTTSFEELQMRLHPAASRVAKLAAAHPARLMAFDLLADEAGESLLAAPLHERRAALERLMPRLDAAVQLSPVSLDAVEAQGWLRALGTGRDGVIGKRRDLAYRAGKRDGMVKVKLVRTADCVVGGFRYLARAREVGSLLLGLYDEAGKLDHVGFTSTIPRTDRAALTARLEALIEPPGFTGNAPGGPSRWSTDKSADWQPLRSEMVVEVTFDHVTGGRFRHGTNLVRFRPDKTPRQCGMEQIC